MSIIRRAVAGAAATPLSQALVDLLDRTVGAAAGVFAVLTYHRVDDREARPWLYPALLSATARQFELQMTLLREHYRPVSMLEILHAFDGGAPLPPRAVHVTFDDAYNDFASNAWPILRALEIPATLFVPTAYARQPQPLFWWDRVWAEAVARNGGATPEVAATVSDMVNRLKALPHQDAMAAVDEYCTGAASAHAPSILAWDELRQLSAEGVYLGCHSRTHPLLSRVDPVEAAAELDGARNDLRREIAGEVGTDVVAYPSGDYDAGVMAVAARLGFKLGFTTRRGANRTGVTGRLELHRINVGLRTDARLLRSQLVMTALQRRARA